MNLQYKGTYQEENLFSVLEEAIPRLSNIGIRPETINYAIEKISGEVRDREDSRELKVSLFSPLETLIIGHDVFEKLALKKANIILNSIRHTTNEFYISKLLQKFETLALEVYYFNEFLPQEYKINFDTPWQAYKQLINIPSTQTA